MRMNQEFPNTISIISEIHQEIEITMKYEWLPIICKKCQALGHTKEVCRKKEETKVTKPKKIWVEKKIAENLEKKQKELDDEGFQEVKRKGKSLAGV